MSDKELLELAAKAAGIEDGYFLDDGTYWVGAYGGGWQWKPLVEDAQAFRLMVQLGIDVEFWLKSEAVEATPTTLSLDSMEEPFGDNPYAATRRAIFRAAAAIGEQMK